ncbi:KAP family P-loop NTPase fold protein [Tenacibaculum larymnensis]|uniref:KAP family NTPase n=1 Tax=Tenacibaculum larymnensis TaxID=2878201 RepID=A0A9X4EL58_9FLAO|nr:P-loop NTPase fold protein [Tenacibaculum larymnensis]MDE1206014.1 KAP family NTPase [Tenacibaculum larymnensis]
MWSDNETSEDLLGFKVHADLLIDVIKDDTVLPITIGVFGDWGSGKSSVLKIIQEEFEKGGSKEEDTLCIYFNGWTFEGYDDAKAALLNSIINEIENNKKLSSEVKETVKNKAKKLWESIDWMRGAGMVLKNIALPAVSAYFTGGVSLAPFAMQKMKEWSIDTPERFIEKLGSEEGKELLNSLKKENVTNDKRINPVAEFRKDFSDLLDATNYKRLVVIIDDLDRCKPDRIIENLEAIKLFVNVPKTAFVIGADPRIVRHAIEYKYGNTNSIQGDNSRIIDDYLEKLIQLPYSLPKLSEPEVDTYISMLICKREIEVDKFKEVYSDFHEFRVKDKYSSYGLLNMQNILSIQEFEKVKSNIISIPSLVPLITQSLYGNPRQIKRFLNTYILRKRLSDVAKLDGFDSSVLAKLMLLEYSEIRLFRQLFEWQLNQKGVPKEIQKLEEICKEDEKTDKSHEIENLGLSEWNKPKIIKWLQIEPKLSEIDLRDYFWISRDKIATSISASSLIPPIVKSLFKELSSEMPARTRKSLIESKFSSLNPLEKDSFLSLLSRHLKKDPKLKISYEIFNQLINSNVDNSVDYYIDSLKVISTKDIPASIGVSLSQFKGHEVLGVFLNNFFKDNTRVSKSYKLDNN